MNFLADESVDYNLVKILRANHYKIYSVMELFAGANDQRVLDVAKAENAILITEDKDFGELVYRLNKLTKGVVLLRLSGLSIRQKSSILLQVFNLHLKKFKNAFVVISEQSIRIRKLPS